MKLSSRRTWLVIAAAGLLLAGAVVMLVVKFVEPPLPPLPSDWTVEDQGDFVIALPPGIRKDESTPAWTRFRVEVGPGVHVSLEESPLILVSETREEAIELFQERMRRIPGMKAKRTTVQGSPALILILDEAGKTGISMVVFTEHIRFTLGADIVPGSFSEKDADTFFRLFRIKTHQ